MIALEHLQVIEIINESGSFRKAAEKLHKAQSAISYSVKLVEDHYEINIFDRSNYRPQLTKEGKLLLDKMRSLLNEANEFDNFARELKGDVELELKIGVTALYPLDKITSLFRELKSEFPKTNIHLNIEVLSGERMLLDGQIDLALIENINQIDKIDYQIVESIQMPLLISKKHPLARLKKYDEKEFLKYPQIILKSTLQNSKDMGVLSNSLKWYVTDMQTKKTLITEGLGWGRLPYHYAKKEILTKSLIEIESNQKFKAEVNVAKLKNKAMGPVAKRFWNYFC